MLGEKIPPQEKVKVSSYSSIAPSTQANVPFSTNPSSSLQGPETGEGQAQGHVSFYDRMPSSSSFPYCSKGRKGRMQIQREKNYVKCVTISFP